jgi:putative ABC transport system permease protein
MYFATFILKNLIRRRTRTALTILGLAVAVGSMIALLGVSANTENAVMSSFERRRIDLVVLQAGRSMGLNSDFREYLVEQARKIPGVEKVSEAVVNLIDVTRESGYTDQIMIQGWRPDNFAFEDLDIIAGRKLEPGDQRKIMLGRTLADNLKKKVGDTVILGKPEKDNASNKFEVIGVYHSFVVFEDGGAIVSIEDGRRLLGMQVTGFSVRVKKSSPDSSEEVEEVRQRIEALRDPEDPSVRLSARTPPEYANSISQLQMIRAMSWLVSSIAVLIGIIGMVNTMAMSVMERTQEIGILRAVGWSRSRVMRMIIGESLLIALAAASVGAVAADLGTRVLTLFPKVNGFIEGGISTRVILEGVAITLLIGVLGGLFPALRAARLLPTEAIRHD